MRRGGVGFGILSVVALAVAMQAPRPIPPYPGDSNPQHDGQPSFCTNVGTEFVHNCDCKHMDEPGKDCKSPDRGGENPKCKVYCRKDACRCRRDCQMTSSLFPTGRKPAGYRTGKTGPFANVLLSNEINSLRVPRSGKEA